MSITGAVPVTCYGDRDCERTYFGKWQCNLSTNQCQERNNGAPDIVEVRPHPLDPPQPSTPAPLTPTGNTFFDTLSQMMDQMTHWSSVVIPGILNPTFWQKFQFVFLGDQNKITVTSVIVLLLTILILVF